MTHREAAYARTQQFRKVEAHMLLFVGIEHIHICIKGPEYRWILLSPVGTWLIRTRPGNQGNKCPKNRWILLSAVGTGLVCLYLSSCSQPRLHKAQLEI